MPIDFDDGEFYVQGAAVDRFKIHQLSWTRIISEVANQKSSDSMEDDTSGRVHWRHSPFREAKSSLGSDSNLDRHRNHYCASAVDSSSTSRCTYSSIMLQMGLYRVKCSFVAYKYLITNLPPHHISMCIRHSCIMFPGHSKLAQNRQTLVV